MFQSVAGLKVTGKVDKATKEKMLEKRCGLPDYAGAGGMFTLYVFIIIKLRHYLFQHYFQNFL